MNIINKITSIGLAATATILNSTAQVRAGTAALPMADAKDTPALVAQNVAPESSVPEMKQQIVELLKEIVQHEQCAVTLDEKNAIFLAPSRSNGQGEDKFYYLRQEEIIDEQDPSEIRVNMKTLEIDMDVDLSGKKSIEVELKVGNNRTADAASYKYNPNLSVYKDGLHSMEMVGSGAVKIIGNPTSETPEGEIEHIQQALKIVQTFKNQVEQQHCAAHSIQNQRF